MTRFQLRLLLRGLVKDANLDVPILEEYMKALKTAKPYTEAMPVYGFPVLEKC